MHLSSSLNACTDYKAPTATSEASRALPEARAPKAEQGSERLQEVAMAKAGESQAAGGKLDWNKKKY